MTTYLSEYANFESKEEMDNTSNQHITSNWSQLNKTDRAVIEMIRRYSVKHGAAHLKHETMEKALNKSNSTIRSALRKLEKLGIIKRVKFIRKVMNGIGANIYTILPFVVKDEQGGIAREDEATKPTTPTSEPTKSETEALSLKSLITKDKIASLRDTYPQESLQTLYERFQSLLKNTVGNNNKLASRLYGVFKSQSIRMMKFDIHADKGELFDVLGLQALKISVQATKKKTIRNFTGYYSGVLQELINKSLFSNSYMDYDVEPDFKICTH